MDLCCMEKRRKSLRGVITNCVNIDVNPLTSAGRIYQCVGLVVLPLLPMLALTAYSCARLVTFSARLHRLDTERTFISDRIGSVPFGMTLQQEYSALVTYFSANRSEVLGTLNEFFYNTDTLRVDVFPWPG